MSRVKAAALVSVGNELLHGETVDTNAAWISRTFASWGIPVVRRFTVRDRSDEIREAVARAAEAADLVVTGGGLGPTADDVTKAAVAEHLGLSLVVDDGVRDSVQTRFRSAGFTETPPLSESQWMILEGSVALPNDRGTAPGILVEHPGGIVVLLPGPPPEMRSVVSGPLARAFEARGIGGRRVVHRVIHTTGIRETVLAELLDGPWSELPTTLREAVALAFLPDELGVDIRLTATEAEPGEADALLERAEQRLAPILDRWRFRGESGDLVDAVARELVSAGATLATAESCTGGLIAKRLTDRAGSSAYFLGGVVAYADSVKTSLLGVSPEVLETHGAVSEAVARQMAVGAVDVFGADYALSVTGVAGPGGGSEEKPVGTVWLGLAEEGTVTAVRRRFPGDRGEIRRRSAQASLELLHDSLRGIVPGA